MNSLEGKEIKLRALEPSDLEFLYELENDESLWEVSNTTTPYSKFVLKQYLKNAHRDIYEVKQLRLVICKKGVERPLGFVDLFDFDPKHNKVGIGMLFLSRKTEAKGMRHNRFNCFVIMPLLICGCIRYMRILRKEMNRASSYSKNSDLYKRELKGLDFFRRNL